MIKEKSYYASVNGKCHVSPRGKLYESVMAIKPGTCKYDQVMSVSSVGRTKTIIQIGIKDEQMIGPINK